MEKLPSLIIHMARGVLRSSPSIATLLRVFSQDQRSKQSAFSLGAGSLKWGRASLWLLKLSRKERIMSFVPFIFGNIENQVLEHWTCQLLVWSKDHGLSGSVSLSRKLNLYRFCDAWDHVFKVVGKMTCQTPSEELSLITVGLEPTRNATNLKGNMEVASWGKWKYMQYISKICRDLC